jgi:hypothetical protein
LTITTSKSRSPICFAALRKRVSWQLLIPFFASGVWGRAAQTYGPSPNENPVKQLTLQQLGEVEVTTASKTPEQVWKTAAAIRDHAGRYRARRVRPAFPKFCV